MTFHLIERGATRHRGDDLADLDAGRCSLRQFLALAGEKAEQDDLLLFTIPSPEPEETSQ